MKKKSGKNTILEQLRDEAAEMRDWLYGHTSPDVPLKEFEEKANRYAILCTRISFIDKH